MTLDIHLTSDWAPERIARYGRQITASMQQMVARFPKDIEIKSLMREILAGERQLWLILDGEEYVSFVLTEIKHNQATDHRTIMVTVLAGEDGLDSTPLIEEIEQYGRDKGCHECSVLGRLGWKRALAKQGYGAELAMFRKGLA